MTEEHHVPGSAGIPRLGGSLEERLDAAHTLYVDGFRSRQVCAACGLTDQSLRVLALLRQLGKVAGRWDLAEFLREARQAPTERLAATAAERGYAPATLEVVAALLEIGKGGRGPREPEPPRRLQQCPRCGVTTVVGRPHACDSR